MPIHFTRSTSWISRLIRWHKGDRYTSAELVARAISAAGIRPPSPQKPVTPESLYRNSNSASPFTLIAADRMAEIIDQMVRDGWLDSRSPLADARLDYGQPYVYEHTPNAAGERIGGQEKTHE